MTKLLINKILTGFPKDFFNITSHNCVIVTGDCSSLLGKYRLSLLYCIICDIGKAN